MILPRGQAMIVVKELDATREDVLKLAAMSQTDIVSSWHAEVILKLESLLARAKNFEAAQAREAATIKLFNGGAQ